MDQAPRMVTAVITLPLLYNPDAEGKRKPVETQKFRDTVVEVGRRFGGWRLKGDPQVIRNLGAAFEMGRQSAAERRAQLGSWFSGARLYLDPEIELETDVPDAPESRDWLREYEKDVLRQRFRQERVYIRLLRWVEPL